jgi:HK97 family phage major capsid protein
MNKRLLEIMARKAEIKQELENTANVLTQERISQLQTDVDVLLKEEAEIRSKIELTGKLGDPIVKPDGKPDENEERAKEFAKTRQTKIGARELRSVLLSTDGIVKPTGVNGSMNEPFNTVSSLIDQVNAQDATGMGSHKVPYVASWQTADKKTDGTAQTASDTTFKSVAINPFLCAVTTYVSRELAKQTPLQYESKVKKGALIALRKKLNAWMVSGGGSTEILGIYNAVNTDSTPGAMYATYSMTAAIGADTLRKIVMQYGGDENVGANARLYLNKNDLIAFGDVRGTNEKKAVYEITPDGTNPNIGIIKDGGLAVPYTICSDVTSYTDATGTAGGVKTMIYGDPANYELDLFGDYEIRVSEDYKFAEGLNTVMGEVMVGGNITVANGFVVVLKKSA